MAERSGDAPEGGQERLLHLFKYLTAKHQADAPLPPVPEALREWGRATSQMALVGIGMGTFVQWRRENAAGPITAPENAPTPAHAARYIAEAKTQRLIRLANRATGVGLRVGGVSAIFFTADLLLRVYDGEQHPRQPAWAGATAGALYGLFSNAGLPSGERDGGGGVPATRLFSAILAGALGSVVGYSVGWVEHATAAWLPEDVRERQAEQWRQMQDITQGKDITPRPPKHPASDSMDVTAAVIASLEASLRDMPGSHRASASVPEEERAPCVQPAVRPWWKLTCVSARTFTAESIPDFPEPETVGWGSTKMADLLQEKGPDSGAWLWVSQDDHVIDAVRKMTKANVGSLLVFDPSKIGEIDGKEKALHAKQEAVVGIFTERDYMTKIAVLGRSSRETKVSAVMTPNPITVSTKHSVLDVMELMINKNFRHVPIVENGRMLGMASMRDVVHVMLQEHREEVGRLQEYIQGTF